VFTNPPPLKKEEKKEKYIYMYMYMKCYSLQETMCIWMFLHERLWWFIHTLLVEFSKFQIHIKIDPSAPVQLVSQDNPGTATVSNTKNYATRCIVRNLKLELRVGNLILKNKQKNPTTKSPQCRLLRVSKVS
jgi:hypothetical protein